MPASGPVSIRSSPINRFTSVDFPTFGRPTIAICSGPPEISSLSNSPVSFSGSPKTVKFCNEPFSNSVRESTIGRRAWYNSSNPSPCSAERPMGSPRPRPYASYKPPTPALPSHLFATRITGILCPLSQFAKCSSRGVIPVPESIKNKATSALLNRTVSLEAHASFEALVLGVLKSCRIDEVEMEVSQATPCFFPIAGYAGYVIDDGELFPANRLNRVDFPTFGRPTMAIRRGIIYRTSYSLSGRQRGPRRCSENRECRRLQPVQW